MYVNFNGRTMHLPTLSPTYFVFISTGLHLFLHVFNLLGEIASRALSKLDASYNEI